MESDKVSIYTFFFTFSNKQIKIDNLLLQIMFLEKGF